MYVVYIVYIKYYIYIYTNFDGLNFKLGTDIVWVVGFKKGMRVLARANRNFWPRTAILSTRHVRCNEIVRAVLRWVRSAAVARTVMIYTYQTVLLPCTSIVQIC